MTAASPSSTSRAGSSGVRPKPARRALRGRGRRRTARHRHPTTCRPEATTRTCDIPATTWALVAMWSTAPRTGACGSCPHSGVGPTPGPPTGWQSRSRLGMFLGGGGTLLPGSPSRPKDLGRFTWSGTPASVGEVRGLRGDESPDLLQQRRQSAPLTTKVFEGRAATVAASIHHDQTCHDTDQRASRRIQHARRAGLAWPSTAAEGEGDDHHIAPTPSRITPTLISAAVGPRAPPDRGDPRQRCRREQSAADGAHHGQDAADQTLMPPRSKRSEQAFRASMKSTTPISGAVHDQGQPVHPISTIRPGVPGRSQPARAGSGPATGGEPHTSIPRTVKPGPM